MFYIIIFFWLLGFIFLWRIPELKRSQGDTPISVGVTVIVPARNEETNLSRLLRSIDHQVVNPDEVIIMDDQSEDATAEIGARYGYRVLRAGETPDGWLGKTWACWQGAHAAQNDILLFLDSDTFLDPNALATLKTAFLKNEGLLTVHPYHRLKKNYERLSAIFNIMVMAGMGVFTPFSKNAKPAGAFGPCLMCRKGPYFETGGHQTARHEILESILIGKAFVEAGHQVYCYGGRGTLSFRMYPQGFASLVEGFSKALVNGANAVSPGVLVMLVCWIYGGVSLTRHLIQSFYGGSPNEIISWLSLDFLYALQIHWMLARIGNFGMRTALFFQIPLLFFVLIFLLSGIKTFILKKTRWKGRVVSTGKKETTASCD